ncbi:MAG: hypothetical protein K2X66_11975 [Cyanobacteria bacterium]|nr:hypothetical protein [Cyanobacteriota bacterium]
MSFGNVPNPNSIIPNTGIYAPMAISQTVNKQFQLLRAQIQEISKAESAESTSEQAGQSGTAGGFRDSTHHHQGQFLSDEERREIIRLAKHRGLKEFHLEEDEPCYLKLKIRPSRRHPTYSEIFHGSSQAPSIEDESTVELISVAQDGTERIVLVLSFAEAHQLFEHGHSGEGHIGALEDTVG